MSSVLDISGTMNVSVPHVNASWLRTSGSDVNASTGSGVCSRASLRTVSPDWVNATSALASRDRKSTRLNSSHVEISYAVFCLKKKKKKNTENVRAIYS